MSGLIHNAYKLRLLQEKLESNQGLSVDELVEFQELQSQLADPPIGREFERHEFDVSAMLRAPGNDALVNVADISPGGLRITGCPELAVGQSVELHLRENDEVSYRFPAQVMWVRVQDEQRMAGVRFVGHPIQMNHGSPAPRPSPDSRQVA